MPGATGTAEGTNFSVFSRSARRVELLLYEASDSREPVQIVDLDPNTNRSYFFWHVFVEGLPPGAYYTWRIYGKELVDPWARIVSDSNWNRGKAISSPASAGDSIRAMVTTDNQLSSREPPLTPGLNGAVIYELHVGGFTKDPSDRRRYQDFSGCGNTINCNHPLVTHFIVNCLEWWVEQMRVDGFRFDLASVFVRGEESNSLVHSRLCRSSLKPGMLEAYTTW